MLRALGGRPFCFRSKVGELGPQHRAETGKRQRVRFIEDPEERVPGLPSKSKPPWGQTFTERNLRTLAPAWGLSLSLDTDHSGWWGQLSGMLVLGCNADVSSDNGQELDFLVWLLPPRPLECEGEQARGPRDLGWADGDQTT